MSSYFRFLPLLRFYVNGLFYFGITLWKQRKRMHMLVFVLTSLHLCCNALLKSCKYTNWMLQLTVCTSHKFFAKCQRRKHSLPYRSVMFIAWELAGWLNQTVGLQEVFDKLDRKNNDDVRIRVEYINNPWLTEIFAWRYKITGTGKGLNFGKVWLPTNSNVQTN